MRQGDGDRAERAPDGGRSRRLLQRFTRHRGATAPAGTAPAATTAPAPEPASPAPHTVRDDFPHRYLLRSSTVPDSPVRALVQALPADPRRPVVVVDVPQSAAGNLGEELGSLLARLRDDEPLSLRLVLSGAAAPAGEGGPLAQRLADAWDVTLEAPDAPAVLAPGGLLHVTEPATPGGGWWRFAPGEAPEPLGTRLPAPRWQRALARVPLGPVGTSVVRAVPAGLALGPADTPAPRPDGPAYAVAVDPERPAVLLGAPRADPVAAEDLATLLASLPTEIRRSLRLVPADGRDAIALAEEVCDLLGTELEVALGLPLATETEEAEGETEGEGKEGEPGRPAPESVRLISAEGEFTWPTPLAALLCSPTGDDGARPAPRPASWSLPASAGTPGPAPATLRLPSGVWAVAVRAGLWIGTTHVPPSPVRDRAGDPRALRVEISAQCLAEESVRERTLRDLAALLAALEPAARAHSELAVSEEAEPEAAAALRRFAIRTGLPLAATSRAAVAPETEPAPEPAPEPEPEPVPMAPASAEPVEPEPAPTPPPPALPTPRASPASAAAPGPRAPARRAPEGFSGEADRRAFRELAAAVWEEHSGPVGQALIRLPALRGSGEDTVRADLIAVRLYLSSAPEEPFGARALAEGTEELRPYAACLASGLRRLPALRGTLVRAVAQPCVPDEVVPGAVLVCDAPLDVVHLEAPAAPVPPSAHVRYAVRPMTARRTSVLSRDDNGPQALFEAGTAFAVVARHEADGELPARVLLAELPVDPGRFREPSPEALERLDAAARRSGTSGTTPWPGRCTGPFLHLP
ncbi:hypothetical protein ACFQ8C_06065 [Streptomyces sp. NPDC056503]|uniref:hypothetical protein n=1 Tax=Streptomyces sp. NPDC056503 TaxID=3345842 RepID=UPI0036AB1CA2